MEHYDLIVVGGGFSGVCAAIESARGGMKVLLIEKFNCLGGAAAGCLVSPFMNYATVMPDTNEKKYLTGDLFLEIVKEMRAVDSRTEESYFDEEVLKLVLNRMCLAAGVKLLFNATVTEAESRDGKIFSVGVWGKSRKLTFSADRFIDASGDAELAVLAGCDFMLGREKDRLCQPMTLCFRMSGVDKAKFKQVRSQITPLYQSLKAKGQIRNPREDVLIFENFHDGVLHFNTTRVVKMDPTDPFAVTQAEIEAREQVFEMQRFLKENIEGFENCRVLSTAMQIGIRESRKIVGEYILTEDDLKSLARFDDAIAVANYDIDIHNPEGAGTSHYYFAKGEWYEIPYRCLVPKGMKNLLVTGRCISSTHAAQASYRIMPFCAELGQAAGVAACLAKTQDCDFPRVNTEKLRASLKEKGFCL